MGKSVRLWSVAAGAALILSFGAAPVSAQTAPTVQVTVAEPDPAEGEDIKIVLAAVEAFSSGGFAGLKAQLGELQRVLDHAPATYPRLSERDGKILFRAHDRADLDGFAQKIAARSSKTGETPRPILAVLDTYGHAALLVGSYYNEVREPKKALPALQKGLALDPSDPKLTSELGVTLLQLGRLEEALASYDRVLAGEEPPLADRDRGRLLRARGFVLTELKRLDEAEQAYRDSLSVEPGHKGAEMELAYIARLRGGAAPTGMTFPTSDKAREGVLPPAPR